MRYMKRHKTEDKWNEVGYDDALNVVLASYKDNRQVRGMLSIANFIPCMFSEIRVYDNEGKTAPEGEMCLIPEELLEEEE